MWALPGQEGTGRGGARVDTAQKQQVLGAMWGCSSEPEKEEWKDAWEIKLLPSGTQSVSGLVSGKGCAPKEMPWRLFLP